MTNDRRVDDEPWDPRVIHLLELVFNQNQAAHDHNVGILDGIMPS